MLLSYVGICYHLIQNTIRLWHAQAYASICWHSLSGNPRMKRALQKCGFQWVWPVASICHHSTCLDIPSYASLDFYWFSLVLIVSHRFQLLLMIVDCFHRFSSFFIDFHYSLLIFMNFIDLYGRSLIFMEFQFMFVDFHSFLVCFIRFYWCPLLSIDFH